MPDTEILPALPAAGAPAVYSLRRDRCVVEPSIRLLRYPLLRGRFTASGGFLEIAGDHQLSVVLDAESLRPSLPFLRGRLIGPRGLNVEEYPDLPFTSLAVHLGQDRSVDLTGRLYLAGTTRELRLRGDLRRVGEDYIVLWAKGILPPPRRPQRGAGLLMRVLGSRRIQVEIAMEFRR
ncbi:MAG TPA: YceI family protein [Amycolatopsis sp.]|jgi:polyisoprenoid-binding protein YceI